MRDISKKFIENIVSKAKKAIQTEEVKSNIKEDGSLEIKISDKDLRKILNRQRIQKALKRNIISDVNASDSIEATICDTDSLCVTVHKDKLNKKIVKYSDIK